MAKAKAKEEETAAVDFGEGASEGQLVDLSGVDDFGEIPVMPRGMYGCSIENLTYGLSQNSGKPMWNVTLEVTQDGEYLKRKLFTHISFSEGALPRTKRTISRLWPSLLEGPFDPEAVANSGQLLGTDCRARVDIEPYEGKPRNRVKDLLEPESGGEFLS